MESNLNSNSLPVLTGSSDHMRYGFKSMDYDHRAPHPVAKLQRQGDMEFKSKLQEVSAHYGSALAMQLATEAQTFGRPRRVMGLESSNIALDVVRGTDITIDYSDFLNKPTDRPEIQKVKLHDVLEVQYGINA